MALLMITIFERDDIATSLKISPTQSKTGEAVRAGKQKQIHPND